MTSRLFDDTTDTTNVLNSKPIGKFSKVIVSHIPYATAYLNKTRFIGFLEMLLNSSR